MNSEMRVREMFTQLTPSQLLNAAADEEFVEHAICDLDPDLMENWPVEVPMAHPFGASRVMWRWEPVAPPKDKFPWADFGMTVAMLAGLVLALWWTR